MAINCKVKSNRNNPMCKGGKFGSVAKSYRNRNTETSLWIDNNEPLYNQKIAFFRNYCKKADKGKFDRNLAKKGFRHLTTAANRSYKKEIGEPLPIEDRRIAENELVKDFQMFRKDGDC